MYCWIQLNDGVMGGAGAKCFKLSFEFALEASDWPDVVITPLFLLMLSGDWRCWFSWNKTQLSSGPDPSRQSAPRTSVCAWPWELWTLLLLQIKVQVQQGCWERGPGFLSKPAGPLLFSSTKKATRSSSWRLLMPISQEIWQHYHECPINLRWSYRWRAHQHPVKALRPCPLLFGCWELSLSSFKRWNLVRSSALL